MNDDVEAIPNYPQARAWADGYNAGAAAVEERTAWKARGREGPIPQTPPNPYVLSTPKEPPRPMKQMIVMRKDLNMRKGKMVAQGAHAARAVAVFHGQDPRFVEWSDGSWTTICVGVGSESELLLLVATAQRAGIIVELIQDAGRTEFGGVPTYTCCALGPDLPEVLDQFTRDLPLM